MNINEIKAITEGLLFAAGDAGIAPKQLSRILDIEKSVVTQVLDTLKRELDANDRGIRLLYTRGSVFLTTKPEHSGYYKRLLETPSVNKLSQASLETLAIICYQQPITRAEIDDIRGVKSERSIRTLLSRSLVEEVGRKHTVGRPLLFGTTTDFLTFFGLSSLDDLPPLPNDMLTMDIEEEADLFFGDMDNIKNA